MQLKIRILAALSAAVLLVGSLCLPAMAAGEEPGQPAPAVAGDWDSLWTFMNENKRAGGAVTLTADITVPANKAGESWQYSPGFRDKGVTIHCEEYTIYVDTAAVLLLEGGKAAFTGVGGDEGLLHIRPGGYLSANAVTLQAADGGNALVQEEGGWASLEQWDASMKCTLEGGLVWADTPILHAARSAVALAVVPEGETAGPAHLPACMDGMDLNYHGSILRVEGAVDWDLSAPSLADRARTLLTGTLAGPMAVNPADQALADTLGLDMDALKGEDCISYSKAECLAVFPADGAALTECSFQARGDMIIADIGFLFSGAPAEARLLWSADEGQTWFVAETEQSPADGEGNLLAIFEERPPDGAWFLVEFRYLQADGTEKLVHTDTIALSDGLVVPMTWSDGHRGGGEPLGGENDAPGPNDPESTPPPETTQPGQSGDGDHTASGDGEEEPSGSSGSSSRSSSSRRHSAASSAPTPPAKEEPEQTPAAIPAPPEGQTEQTEAAPPAVTQQPDTAASQPSASQPAAAQARGGQSTGKAGGKAASPSVSPAASAVPAAPEPAAEPALESIPEPEPASSAEQPETPEPTVTPAQNEGPSPAAQTAAGLGAVALIGAAAFAALHPKLLRRLCKRKK